MSPKFTHVCFAKVTKGKDEKEEENKHQKCPRVIYTALHNAGLAALIEHCSDREAHLV